MSAIQRCRAMAALAALLCCPTANPSPLAALDYLTTVQGETQRVLAGKVEVEAEDGGVLLLAPDGMLWPLAKEQIVSRRSDAKPFAPLGREALTAKLKAELPGFKVFATQNYLIAYNTSPAYAQCAGPLF